MTKKVVIRTVPLTTLMTLFTFPSLDIHICYILKDYLFNILFIHLVFMKENYSSGREGRVYGTEVQT